MTVSVVMPVFNGADWVADAVASVLTQAGVELALQIHDDGSTDATAEVLRELAARDDRIELSHDRNRGPAASRNRLLERATGEYVAFLDHDDIWPQGRLARQVTALDAAPQAPGVLGETIVFEALDAAGAPAHSPRSRRVRAGLLQAGLFRRPAIAATGGFAREFTVGDDFDFLLRLIETCGPLRIDPEVAVWYRLHDGQWTADLELTAQATARAVARSLRRRRGAGDAAVLTWRDSG